MDIIVLCECDSLNCHKSVKIPYEKIVKIRENSRFPNGLLCHWGE